MRDLRKQFWGTMCKLAKCDKSIVVLTGDLGFSFYEEFAQKYPNQFINCGIAEQNIIGVAAGLAIQGFKPYIYSNAIFLLSRGHEFVRDDVAFNNLNVKLCGTGASGFLGFTHNIQPQENIKSWLKGIPIKQFYPKDKKSLTSALKSKKGAFIRI